MSGREYLLRVLGLSAVPRLLTFGLTLVSFPLMVHALGAAEYGVLVFLGAITQVLESGVDFGVSSAAGKNIAAARDLRPDSLRSEVLRWARLQATVASIGLLPLLGITWMIASRTATVDLPASLVVVSVLAVWMNIGLNFVRASLTSLMAFKSLAVLDTTESLTRSALYVAVAFLFPRAMGLATATLLVAVLASTTGALLLRRALLTRPMSPASAASAVLPKSYMLRESGSFLWLRVAIRSYQSIPLFLIGKLYGPAVIGVIGAFAKLIEMACFPMTVIGNALAVRVHGIMSRGADAVRAVWDAAWRFMAAAAVPAVSVMLVAPLATVLLVEDRSWSPLVAVMSITIFTTAVSVLVVPMSDYVGALRSRNILISLAAVAQIPVILIGGSLGGAFGAAVGLVVAQALVSGGYLYIAMRALHPSSGHRVRPELAYFAGLIALAITIVLGMHAMSLFAWLPVVQWHGESLMPVLVLLLIVLLGLLGHSRARPYFLSMRFFDFEAPALPSQADSVRSGQPA